MIRNQSIIDSVFLKYEIAATSCALFPGDRVVPNMVIGQEHATGELIRSGSHGRVATIYFNPMHDSMMIMIECNMDRIYYS